MSHTPPEKRDEAIFEIVNQLNRAATLITSQDEREQLAELNLIAGKRAKASTAYTSALNYLTAGAALLVGESWERRHELMFSLELQRAECEFLIGQSAAAEIGWLCFHPAPRALSNLQPSLVYVWTRTLSWMRWIARWLSVLITSDIWALNGQPTRLKRKGGANTSESGRSLEAVRSSSSLSYP